MAQLVECQTSAQVPILRFVASSPVSGSVLTAQSLDGPCFRFCVPLSLCSFSTHTLSLSLSKINIKIFLNNNNININWFIFLLLYPSPFSKPTQPGRINSFSTLFWYLPSCFYGFSSTCWFINIKHILLTFYYGRWWFISLTLTSVSLSK